MTSGLITCLGNRIEPGDEVILSPGQCQLCNVNIALEWPVFADIDPETFNIDPEQIKKKISKKIKAIMVVDIFGHPAPYKEIIEIAKKIN